ncbi:MAG: hypothetical protein RhofKO_37070 [Rhodothermales bacterium]
MKILTLFGLLVSLSTGTALARDVDCTSETTLEALVACVKGHMPVENAEIFEVPDNAEQTAWNTVVTDMMEDNGSCSVTLPAALSANFTVFQLTDTGNSRNYCVLLETTDGNADDLFDFGWGMFIVYHGATRNLSIEVPHPKNEQFTPEQGIYLFRETSARTFVMAGAHRKSVSSDSACQGPGNGNYEIADAAHNIAHPYHLSTVAMDAYYTGIGANYTAIQFHGMANSTCPDVTGYLTHGVSGTPAANDPVVDLRNQLAAAVPADSNWVINVPGDAPVCGLNGFRNVQGRLLNGVAAASVCGTSSGGNYSGYFIHVEQEKSLRRDYAWPYWATALSNAALPVELTAFSAVQDGAEVRLMWTTASETNNAGFHIEHATCGLMGCEQPQWSEVAFVSGQGTTLEAQAYTHRLTDLASGRHTFRLRQVDYDGTTAYSPLIEVEISATSEFTLLEPSPHPVQQRTRLGWQTSEAQPVQAALFDVQGRRIRTLYDGVTSGMHRLDLDVSDVASGLYLVRITTPKGRYHLPLTVAR